MSRFRKLWVTLSMTMSDQLVGPEKTVAVAETFFTKVQRSGRLPWTSDGRLQNDFVGDDGTGFGHVHSNWKMCVESFS